MIYILSQDYATLAIAKNTGASMPYYEDLKKENIESGSSSYEFRVPSSHPDSEHLVAGNYVARKGLDNEYLLFSIMEVEEVHSDIQEKVVYCEDAGLELWNEVSTPYKETSAKDIKYYLEKEIGDTGWDIGYCDVTVTRTLEFTEYEKAYERIQKIASEFDQAELSFTVKMKGSTVSKKVINIYTKRGNDTGKRFEYNKDITEIRKKVDATNVVTAILGVGQTDDKGVTTDLKTISFDDGNYYSVAGSQYIYSREALKKWGKQAGNIHGVFQYETSSPTELKNRALTYLKANENPSITYEVSVLLLERIAGYEGDKARIGDTVKVIDNTYNPPLLLEARIKELETSFTDPSKDKATLGNFVVKKSNISSAVKALQSKLLQKEATWEQIGETIFKDVLPPVEPVINQLWLDLNTVPNILYRWDGTQWVKTSFDQVDLDAIGDIAEEALIIANGRELAVTKSTTPPSNPVVDQLWIDKASNLLKIWTGSEWKATSLDELAVGGIVDTAIDGIEIGGENLILNSAPLNETGWNSLGQITIADEATAPLGKAISYTVVSGDTGIIKDAVYQLEAGQEYTWSVFMKASSLGTVQIGCEQGGLKSVMMSSDYTRYTHTFTASSSTDYDFRFDVQSLPVGTTVMIHSLKLEKGNKPTSWSNSSREVQDGIDFISLRLNDVEQLVTEDAIITTVTQSSQYLQQLGEKANASDLGQYATTGDLSRVEGDLIEYVDDKVGSIDLTPFAQKSELEQTANEINAKFSSAGGINLLKNSVGYAGLNFWTLTTGAINTIQNEELQVRGAGSGFELNNGTIKQTIVVEPNSYTTVSFKVKKGATGTATFKVTDGVTTQTKTFASGTAFDYKEDKIVFAPVGNLLTIEISGTAGVFTSIMANIGSEALQWQHSNGEVYNTNVQMDLNGITVISSAYKGYTAITPQEFSGYAEVDGVMTKVFTLNKDTTEVTKLDVDKDIKIGKVKMVAITSSTKNGLAFIRDDS